MDQAEAVFEDETQVADETEVQEAPEQQEESAAAEGATAAPAEDDDGEIVVSIAGESPSPEEEEADRAPTWVRELRKSNREKERRIRELEQRLSQQQPQEAAVVVGAKPTLEGCDYDSDKFAEALEQWHERKRAADEQVKQQQAREQQAAQAWQARLQDYGTKAAALRVKDFAEAEEAARDVLSVTQQGVIVSGCDNPALVVYALGRNPAVAQRLAAIQDPVKFAVELGKLEANLKTAPKRVAPAPEKVVRAAGALPAVGAAAVEKLRQKAQQTGDFTEYLAAKRKLKG